MIPRVQRQRLLQGGLYEGSQGFSFSLALIFISSVKILEYIYVELLNTDYDLSN